MADKIITQLSVDTSIVEGDGSQTAQTRLFFKTLLEAIDEFRVLDGVGSPEGVVEALQKKRYMDTSGTAGNIYYIKRDGDVLGDKTKGWILI